MTASGATIRFGLIGVDSTHSVSFTKLFGDGRTGVVKGGTIAAAWQGPTTADFPPSRDRNDELAAQMAQLGVPFLATPEEVAVAVDALLVVASDARTHPGYLAQLCGYGKPIYIDTRFALTSGEAATMLEQAEAAGCLVLAGSPKRFAAEYLDAVQTLGSRIERMDLEGGLPEEPHHPFLAWYGVHLVELAVAAFGAECVSVAAQAGEVVLEWADGRVARLRGGPDWVPYTRGTLHADGFDTSFDIEARPQMLVGLLESIVTACRTGERNVPSAQILATVGIVEAAARSLHTQQPVVPAVTVTTSAAGGESSGPPAPR